MMLSIMVVGAGAVFDDQDQIDSKHQEAVNMCVSLKIIEGKDNNLFDPLGDVKRSEMTKMIAVALNGGKVPTLGTSDNPIFVDVPSTHWAQPFIENAYVQGIVSGVGDNKFDPDGQVTGVQAAKMLLVALGYNAQVEKFEGPNWDVYVNQKAGLENLYENLADIDVNAPLSREHAAEMIWNALQAMTIEKTSSVDRTTGDITDTYTKTKIDMLEKYYGASSGVGILTGWEYDSDKDEWTYSVALDQDTSPNKLPEKNGFTCDTDYTDLFQQNVKVVWKENKGGDITIYGVTAKDSSVLAEGVLGDVDFADLGDKSIDIGDNSYKTTNKTVALYAINEDTGITANSSYKVADTDLGFTMKAIDNDGDNKVDVIAYLPFTVEEVTYLGTKTITTSLPEGVSGTATGNVNIEDIELGEGIEEDDYVMIVAAENTAKDVAEYTKIELVSGEVSKVKGSDITVDGEVCSLANGQKVELGEEYDFAVVNGYIYVASAVNNDVDVSDYALVLAVQPTPDWDAKNAKVSLLLADKTEKTAVEYSKDSDKIEAGDVVYIDDIDDGVYTLKVLADKYKITDSTFSDEGQYDKDTAKVTTDKAYTISDTAVIFTWNDKDKEGDVITGKDLKTHDNLTVADVMTKEDSKTGLTSMIFGLVNDEDLSSTEDLSYGYVVADVANVKNDDGDKVYELTLSDGTSLLTKAKDSDVEEIAPTIKEGTVISYELTDGAVTTLNVLGVVGNDEIDGNEVAISGYDGTVVTFGSNATTYEVTSDTVIIYVDSSATDKGAEGGKIVKAQKDAAGKLIENAIFAVASKPEVNDNGNIELELLVVDVNNNINDVDLKVSSTSGS